MAYLHLTYVNLTIWVWERNRVYREPKPRLFSVLLEPATWPQVWAYMAPCEAASCWGKCTQWDFLPYNFLWPWTEVLMCLLQAARLCRETVIRNPSLSLWNLCWLSWTYIFKALATLDCWGILSEFPKWALYCGHIPSGAEWSARPLRCEEPFVSVPSPVRGASSQ